MPQARARRGLSISSAGLAHREDAARRPEARPRGPGPLLATGPGAVRGSEPVNVSASTAHHRNVLDTWSIRPTTSGSQVGERWVKNGLDDLCYRIPNSTHSSQIGQCIRHFTHATSIPPHSIVGKADSSVLPGRHTDAAFSLDRSRVSSAAVMPSRAAGSHAGPAPETDHEDRSAIQPRTPSRFELGPPTGGSRSRPASQSVSPCRRYDFFVH